MTVKIALSSVEFREDDETILDICGRIKPKPLGPYLEEFVIPLGVKYIELWTPQFGNKENIEEVKNTLTSYDVKVAAVTDFNPLSFSSAPVEASGLATWRMKLFEDAMDIAVELDSKYVMTCGGPYTMTGYDRAFANFVKNITPAIKWAEDRGLTILLENEGANDIGGKADRMLKMMKELNSPTVKHNYDAVNYYHAGEEAFPYAFELLKEYIGFVHVKGSRKALYEGEPYWERMVPCNLGSVNMDGLIQNLKAINYDGFISTEPHTMGKARTFKLFKANVEYLKSKGFE